jgi:hypothetical protein
MAVFAVGLAAFTVKGPRVRPSGELRGWLLRRLS